LAADFISEKTVEREALLLRKMGGQSPDGSIPQRYAQDVARLCEEINLLYVAVTRARKKLLLPEFLRPKGFPECAAIEWLKKEAPEEEAETPTAPKVQIRTAPVNPPNKAYSVSEIKEKHLRAYEPWNDAQDAELLRKVEEGVSISALAQQFGRTSGGIRSRIRKLSGVEYNVDAAG
jgi:ATP-dependent exoDNAse (exonuclease V) beta subunit